MTLYRNFITFTLTLLIALLFTACDTKTQEAESNATHTTNTTTETTGSGTDDNVVTDSVSDNNTSTGGNDNTATTVTPTSLKLSINKTTLKKDENTTVEVLATYADNSTKVLTNVKWIVTPKESVEVNGATLTAKKANATTLQAKVGNTLSNTINLNITWIVNGHVLPPEPDKTLNDATLLGIDVNDNGVRDDVERYIYERFGKDPEYPKTKIGIALQYAKAYQFIMGNDPQNAFENKSYKKMDYALDCKWYWYRMIPRESNILSVEQSIKRRKFRLKNKIYDDGYKEIFFNTKLRMKAYFYYNSSMSGHVLGGGGGVLSSTKDKCNFDIDSLSEIK